jgi:hypothetical protein
VYAYRNVGKRCGHDAQPPVRPSDRRTSDALANGLLHKIQHSRRTEAFRKVPPHELTGRVSEIYQHLGEWLLDKSEADIEKRYSEIGFRRAHQGVPLSQLIWAIMLTKDNLWEFILEDSYPDRPIEVFGKQELLQLLDQFFERAIYAAALGYELAAEAKMKAEHKRKAA